VLAAAGGIVVLFATQWDRWVGTATRQVTDDAYIRSDITPLSAKVEGYIRRVAVDTSSRTSAALVRVLLRDRLGRDPEYAPMPPDVPIMLNSADAALVIGDPALYYDGDAARLDLGAEWTERTGRPFVYAFWAGRPGVVSPEDVARLQAALAAGLGSVGTIAASYNGHPDRAALNEAYLRGNISYALGAAELGGLSEFYARAHARGLIARVPELRFHGHP
jgi:predicted solute-binding protein